MSIITYHATQSSADKQVISGSLAQSDVCILRSLGKHDEVESALKVWEHKHSLVFTLRDINLPGLQDALVPFVTCLVQAKAYPHTDRDRWPQVAESQAPVMEALRSLGCVQAEFVEGKGTCCALTHNAIDGGRLQPQWTLSNPKPVLCVRDGIPLEDRTSYELMQLLLQDGWEWRAYTKRGGRLLYYKLGDAKVFYSPPGNSSPISPAYLQCLIKAEDSFPFCFS